MASADSGLNSIVDFATDSGSTSTAPETPAVETVAETPEVTTAEGGEQGTETTNSDGTEQTPEQKAEAAKAAEPGLIGKITHQVRALLKNMREQADVNTPEGKDQVAAVKQLHQQFERASAYQQVFPKVEEARAAKEFLTEVGGVEGARQTLQSVQESDEKLYAGDPALISAIVDDLKTEGKIDALGKLAEPFLTALRKEDEPGYYKAVAPHFLRGLQESDFPAAVNGLHNALKSGNVESAKQIVEGLANWYNGLSRNIEKQNSVDPEREKLNQEKQEWEQSKQTEVQTGIAKEADSHNNRALGSALKSYLHTPFFKGFPREALVDLGNGLKAELYADLKADKAYQTQMKALWSAKKPDRARIVQYHQAKVDSIAEDIVQRVVARRYPGYAKGGPAAGRIAAAAQKTAATNAANAKAVATGKPIYVPQKPAWDSIDWTKDPKQLNYIAGRAYLKSGKLVTWRK
jgi:hypothetical protein